ncbi:MAG TPA: hypothetical protein PLK05_00455 [Steroidobacteraceae bacterium]|nr:hypothetical protein [Steroidobacteraceae bacterium]HQX47101.1 hypothetical protein [Steroidobacteraceae bacterium]
MTAKPSSLEDRAKLLELEAELQRRTLRASVDTLAGARGITWVLAGASLATKLTVLRRAKWAGYALLAAQLAFKWRRARRDRKRLPK